MQTFIVRLLLGVSVVSLVSLTGCSGSNNSSAVTQTVSGTASSGAAYTGPVTLQDSRHVLRNTTSSSTGFFTVDVAGLTAPFFINAGTLYSVATGAGTANVNPLTDLVARSVFNASSGAAVFASYSSNRSTLNLTKITEDMGTARTNLNSQLATLYAKYQLTTPDFQSGTITIDKGIDALFKDIKVTVSDGTVSIKSADGTKTLVSGSINGKIFSFNSYSTAIRSLTVSSNVTVTTGACDTGFVGATATTSGLSIPSICGTVTYCIRPSGSTQTDAYLLIGSSKIWIETLGLNTSSANYLSYYTNLGQQIAAACSK